MGTERARFPFGHLLPAVRVVAPNGQQPTDEIHVAPPQRQQLALS